MANPEAVLPSAEQPNVLCKRCAESNATLQIRSEPVCQFVIHLSILIWFLLINRFLPENASHSMLKQRQ